MKTNSNSRSAFFVVRVVLGCALCSTGVVLALAALNKSGAQIPDTKIVTSQPGTWTPTGSMSIARLSQATLLSNGKVLVVGGYSGSAFLSSAELYDSSTGTWTTTGSMTKPRSSFSLTPLPDGKILVAGGTVQSCLTTSSAELYDPVTGIWTRTGNMNIGRGGHAAALVTDGPLSGMVLISGGYINQNDGACGGVAQLASSELYDPATGLWSETSDMTIARDGPGAVTLADGSIFVVGNVSCCPYHWLNSAESYDATSQVWMPTVHKATFANAAPVLLTDGRVLAAGGVKGTQPTAVNVADAELFDPSTGTWAATASMSTDRNGHTLTVLNSGQVLVAGGLSGGWGVCNDITSAELYDSTAGVWFPTGNMTVARFSHMATVLPNGQVLVAGGTDCEGNILSSAELYTPPTIVSVSTASLTFGVQLVGTSSDAQTVTLTNTGPTTLTIASITTSSDFPETNTCGSTLATGASCDIDITFAPTAKDVRTGTLTITDDAAGSPQTVALAGTGTVVQLSPLRINFGDQNLGKLSRPQAVTLTNTASTPLSIRGTGVVGQNFADFVLTSTCGPTVPANASCELDVRFKPTATGSRTASAKVQHDGGGAQPVKLTGNGVSN